MTKPDPGSARKNPAAADSAQPIALVVRTAGTNCDAEMVRAFELAGAATQLIHVDRLVEDPAPIDTASLIGFPGGFSYGDDIASGRVLAAKMRRRLWGPLRVAAERGVAMIGACNGFQVMVQLGLLPGPDDNAWPIEPPEPTVALTDNAGARFIDRWVGVEAEAASSCIWTAPLTDPAVAGTPAAMLPIAHGEGRLFVRNEEAGLAALERGGRIALRYTQDVNGSAGRVAGICDASGRIFGLMPHPERYTAWTHHPFWTRLPADMRIGDAPGLAMFRAAVEAVRTSPVGASPA